MVNEGLAMLAEGVAPMTLERAATQSGYPVGPLQLTDELNMELMAKIAKATRDAAERDGAAYDEAAHHVRAGSDVVRRMIELGRPSRLKGAGFYDYADGRRPPCGPAWPRSSPSEPDRVPFRDVKDRMLFIEVLETAKCFEEGVHRLRGRRQHRLDHGHRLPARHRRRRAVHDRLPGSRRTPTPRSVCRPSWREPTSSPTTYGDRFRPTDRLREMAANGEGFPA